MKTTRDYVARRLRELAGKPIPFGRRVLRRGRKRRGEGT